MNIKQSKNSKYLILNEFLNALISYFCKFINTNNVKLVKIVIKKIINL